MKTRTGKIARLPLKVREELNRRLMENQPGSKILPWLNGLPETVALLAEEFDGIAIEDNNLSNWRRGGFEEWRRRNEQVESTREMAQFAMRMAKASGGSLTDGASQILAGKILELLEQVQETEPDPKVLRDLAGMVTKLRKGDQVNEKLAMDREKLQQDAESLRIERAAFEMKFCEKLLDAANLQVARDIAASDRSNSEKIQALRKAYFQDVDSAQEAGTVHLPE